MWQMLDGGKYMAWVFQTLQIAHCTLLLLTLLHPPKVWKWSYNVNNDTIKTAGIEFQHLFGAFLHHYSVVAIQVQKKALVKTLRGFYKLLSLCLVWSCALIQSSGTPFFWGNDDNWCAWISHWNDMNFWFQQYLYSVWAESQLPQQRISWLFVTCQQDPIV